MSGHWTDEEMQILREYYPKIGAIGIHRKGLLDRTYSAIADKAGRMGLRLDTPGWTDEEDDYLLENVWTPVATLAERLGRTEVAVRHRRLAIGAARPLDPNQYRIEDGVVYMQLRSFDGSTCATTTFDESDLDRVLELENRWCLHDTHKGRGSYRYAYTQQDRQTIMMHRWIMDTDERITHVDGNGLNNQRSNLLITGSGDMTAHKVTTRSHRKYDLPRGVTRDKNSRVRPLRAQMGVKGDVCRLGSYDDATEAHTVYLVARAIRYWDRRDRVGRVADLTLTDRARGYLENLLDHLDDLDRDELTRRIDVLTREWDL